MKLHNLQYKHRTDGFRRPFISSAEQEEDDDDDQVCCLRDGPGGCAAAAPDDGHARGCAVLLQRQMLPGSPGMPLGDGQALMAKGV
jgi:hypothetical protein